MKIGIIGAMEMEVETLKERMQDRKVTTRAMMDFCEGKLGKQDVVIVRSGVGKVNAAVCTQILIDDYHVTHIMNSGVAGSLNNDINVGDIVVSVDAMYHDVDATVVGYKKGEVPQLGRLYFEADPELRKLALKGVREAADPGYQIFEGRIVSGDAFVANRSAREAIKEMSDGDCVEMESAAIAHTSWLNGIPFVIIRAISDKADESVVESYDAFEKVAAVRCAGLVGYMVEHIAE